jgi:hypothetical protein
MSILLIFLDEAVSIGKAAEPHAATERAMAANVRAASIHLTEFIIAVTPCGALNHLQA